MPLHLQKLCVGVDTVEALEAIWASEARSRRPSITTRHQPKRAAEILTGGSLYWVIRGWLAVRQNILGLDPDVLEDGSACCRITLDPTLVRVDPRACRPFQGWRYLSAAAAPPDLEVPRPGDDPAMPPGLKAELRALGLL